MPPPIYQIGRPKCAVTGPSGRQIPFYEQDMYQWYDLEQVGITEARRTLHVDFIASGYRILICAHTEGPERELHKGVHELVEGIKYVTAKRDPPQEPVPRNEL